MITAAQIIANTVNNEYYVNAEYNPKDVQVSFDYHASTHPNIEAEATVYVSYDVEMYSKTYYGADAVEKAAAYANKKVKFFNKHIAA